MKKYIALVVTAGAVVLAGCASIVSKSEYPVAITSNPIGADFVVKRKNGVPVASGVTPATIVLPASEGYFQPAKYTIEYKRKGVMQSVPLTAKIDGWYFGNLLFGGVIIGMLIVDPATGAMRRKFGSGPRVRCTASFSDGCFTRARRSNARCVSNFPPQPR